MTDIDICVAENVLIPQATEQSSRSPFSLHIFFYRLGLSCVLVCFKSQFDFSAHVCLGVTLPSPKQATFGHDLVPHNQLAAAHGRTQA